MTIITRVPGITPPAGFGIDLGLDFNHAYLPAGVTSGGWRDEINGLDLTAYGTGGLQKLTENGQPYAYFSGTVLARTAVPAFANTEAQTVIVVARPNDADIAVGGGHLFNGGSVAIIQGGSSGAPAGSRSGNTPTLLPSSVRNKWHMYAISTPVNAAGVFVVDGLNVALPGTTAATSISVGGQPTANYRQLRVAAVLTSAAVTDAATLNGTVYPRVKQLFPKLAWA